MAGADVTDKQRQEEVDIDELPLCIFGRLKLNSSRKVIGSEDYL